MQQARTTFAIFALAAMFGCTVQSPSTTPTTVKVKLQLPATEATFFLTRDLARRFAGQFGQPIFEVTERSYQRLMEQLAQGSISYFTSSHVPARDDIWAAPLAVDGLAIIVNPRNPLTTLQLEDLRDVFAGRIVDWSDYGGPAGHIAPLTVSASADTYLELQRMLTGVAGVTGNARLVPSFRAMLNIVAEESDAIGYVPLSMIGESVKVLAIKGIMPDPTSMSEQRYPLRSTIYVIGREEPPPAYRNLIGWIQSEAGQAVVAESYTELP